MAKENKIIVISTIIILIIIGYAAVAFFGVLHIPKAYSYHGTLNQVTWQGYAHYNLCEYILPQGFEFIKYAEGKRNVKKLGLWLFSNSQKQQTLLITRLPNHLKVDLNDIKLEKNNVKRTVYRIHQNVKDLVEYWYYIPFFYKARPPDENRSLILRGMDNVRHKKITTDKTDIYIWYGNFEKLDLDKRKDSWRGYIVEVLDFFEPKKGAIALIKNKDPRAKALYIDIENVPFKDYPIDLKDATLFTITCVPQNVTLDKEEFESFVRSIDFNAKVYDPIVYLREQKGHKFKVIERRLK